MLKISDDIIEVIADMITQHIKQGRLLKRDAEGGDGWQGKENLEIFWYDYIKRVDPHEKKYIVIINSMLTRQAKEVFDKIKKYPNSYKKWMFDRKKWLREFADAEAKFIVKIYKQEGQKAIDLALKLSRKSYYKAEEIPISIAFDVYNPEVTEALVTQTTRFPAGVVGTSEEIIRREIANGLELGESIDKLRKRVTERLGPTYIKNRAEMIARSETIYASNAGAELGYMQSGVVEGKKWLTAIDERTCFPCTDMNNMTAPVGQPTWEKEGLDVGGVQSKYDLDFSYTEGAMPFPPLHPRCRCTIIPIVERIEKGLPKLDYDIVNKKRQSLALRESEEVFNAYAKDNGLKNAKAYNKKATEYLKKTIDNATVNIRVDGRVLDDIIRDERFRTQFEVKRSSGAYAPKSRIKLENTLFGTKNDIDKKLRPIYGFLEDKTNLNAGATKMYGNVKIVLDKEYMINRITFVGDDSLTILYEDYMCPQLLKNPSAITFSEDIVRLKGNLGELQSFWNYTEVQIHGGLNFNKNTIRKIITKVGDLTQSTLDKLGNLGIKVEFIR